MIIREGFVSNSSSQSFCVYGRYFDDDVEDIDEKLEKFNKGQNISLEYAYPYGGSCCIGRSLSDIGDNETGREFKDKVQKLIDMFCDENDIPKAECIIIEEGWTDG